MSEKYIVIQDVDGTLANVDHRLHYIKQLKDSKKRDWKNFFAEAKYDTPYDHILKMNRMFAEDPDCDIYLITGRPENLRMDTQEWLLKHGISYNALYMRAANDRRPDYESKRDVFETQLGHRKDQVLCVFEDRLPVCKMWRDIGLNVVVCGNEWLEQDWSE